MALQNPVTIELPLRPQAFVWWLGLATVTCIGLSILSHRFRPQLRFIWHCFLRPITGQDQRTRLDMFYRGQAEVYDATRNGLLRGRISMLGLSASHLRALRAQSPGKRLVWVDIGGGTGYTIEQMNEFFPISEFDEVYLVDLCEPLLAVARARFAQRGWTNVTVLCQDASEFMLPSWENGVDPRGSVGFVTLSYSLSMIPNFYALLDRIDHVLSPSDGLLSVVDLYTAARHPSPHNRAIGGESKECGWLSRWFWQIWFDFDHVSLSPLRRDYLEHKFGTIKIYNGRNRFVLPFIVRIPYYIWLGRSRDCDVSSFRRAFEIDGGNTLGNGQSPPPSPSTAVNSPIVRPITPLDLESPLLDLSAAKSLARREKEAFIEGGTIVKVNPPLSAFHYQIGRPWRLPYYEQAIHKEFRTFIYSFTWEDPFEDMKYLDLGKDDSILAITSAGDNVLHYAIHARPERIHCVDMNPCQGHLLELKLAALSNLPHTDVFDLFGKGTHPNFPSILTDKLAPHLSAPAFNFWRGAAGRAFLKKFYLTGYSGLALSFISFVFRLTGRTGDVKALSSARTLEEQKKIWEARLRPVLFNKLVVALVKNPVFCWNALGVPMNQRNMILEEGSLWDFVRDTLDPLASTYLFGEGAYHYLLAMLGHYTPESCPEYLKPAGMDALRADDGKALDAFRLHTDSIINVLKGLSPGALTRAVLMDHLDWFARGSIEVDEEIDALSRVLVSGGIVLWRSAGRQPWYAEVFARKGFKVTALAVRSGPEKPIDRVNMYASFWRAVKL